MNRHEDDLRTLLHGHVEDVTASPDLFDAVRDRRDRLDRRGRVLTAAGALGAAAAVAVGGVVLLDRPSPPPSIDIAESPDDAAPATTPSDAAPAPRPDPDAVLTTTVAGAQVPTHAVVVVDRRIDLVRVDLDGATSSVVATLLDLTPPPADECPECQEAVVPAHVAVRPGSTPRDVTALVTLTGEGLWEHRLLRAVDDGDGFTVTFEHWDGVPNASRADAPTTSAVWAPDGRHVAWLEFHAREAAGGDPATLVTAGYVEGAARLGTGRPADDNAAFDLGDLPGGVLQYWRWDTVDGVTATGWLYANDGDGTSLVVPVQRQADGALAIGEPVARRSDRVLAAEDDGRDLPTWSYSVLAEQDGLRLAANADGDQLTRASLPDGQGRWRVVGGHDAVLALRHDSLANGDLASRTAVAATVVDGSITEVAWPLGDAVTSVDWVS